MTKTKGFVFGDPLLVERKGNILTLTINRPRDNNAIDAQVRAQLLRALREAAQDQAVRVLVLTSAGEDVFSSGLDIQELASLTSANAEALALELRRVHEALLALNVPSVAAIKGACVGSGLELALHCDLRFARSDARFAFPGIGIGLVPGAGSIRRLQQLIGAGPASALLMTGSIVNAERAYLAGLVTNVVAQGSFQEAIDDFAQFLAMLPAVAMTELKALMRLAEDAPMETLVARGAAALKACFSQGEVLDRLRQLYSGPGPDTTVH